MELSDRFGVHAEETRMPPDRSNAPTLVTILRTARERLTDPEHWLHDHEDEAVDAAGAGCLPWSQDAVRWDVYGALGVLETNERGTDAALEYLVEVLDLDGLPTDFSAVMRWHDAPERTHAEVLDALDAALALAERDAPMALRATPEAVG